LVIALDSREDLRTLRSQGNALNREFSADQAARAEALTQIGNAVILSSTIVKVQNMLLEVNSVAAQAQAALATAGPTSAAVTAQSIVTQSSTLVAQNAIVLQQTQSAQAAIASAGRVTPELRNQLVTALQQSEVVRAQANATASALNILLSQFRNVPNVPIVSISSWSKDPYLHPQVFP
jgi:hypothetical protein